MSHSLYDHAYWRVTLSLRKEDTGNIFFFCFFMLTYSNSVVYFVDLPCVDVEKIIQTGNVLIVEDVSLSAVQ